MFALYALGFVLASTGAGSDTVFTPNIEPNRAPIELWMSGDRRFREGERVRVQVETEVDGFLLVLHADPEGRVRVLFPVEPQDDALVRAGRRYEIRATDNARDAFIARYEGTGMVWAAVSADPWRFDEITRDGRWDYAGLDIDRDGDAEDELTEVAQRIASSRGFDYDVLGYRVYGSHPYVTTTTYYPRTVYIYDDYMFCGGWYWRYHGCNRWPFDGGFFVGVGFGSFYDPWYSPYRYRYGYGYGGYPYNPYYPRYPYYPGGVFAGGSRPYVAGRPRGYTIERRNFGGTTTTLAGTGSVGGSSLPINWRARDPERSRARPATRDGIGGDYGPAGGARPSRGDTDGNGRPAARPARTRSRGDDRGGDRGGSVPSARPSSGDRGSPRPSVERSRGNGRSRGDLEISDGIERPPTADRELQASGEGPARRARPNAGDNHGGERLVRRGGSGIDERRDPPAVRSEPRGERRDPPAARSEPRGERRDPPAARSEPRGERRDPPAARSEPRGERREPPAARSEPRGERRDAPPARSEPRRESPPPSRAEPSRGNGGGGQGGGHSAPSRSRGRGDRP